MKVWIPFYLDTQLSVKDAKASDLLFRFHDSRKKQIIKKGESAGYSVSMKNEFKPHSIPRFELFHNTRSNDARFKQKLSKSTAYFRSLLRGIIAGNHPPFFKNIFKFCPFLHKLSNILPFFNISSPFFWKIVCMPLRSRIGLKSVLIMQPELYFA